MLISKVLERENVKMFFANWFRSELKMCHYKNHKNTLEHWDWNHLHDHHKHDSFDLVFVVEKSFHDSELILLPNRIDQIDQPEKNPPLWHGSKILGLLETSLSWSPPPIRFEIALPPLDDSQEDHPRTSRSIPYIPDQDDESIPIHAFKYLKLYLTYHTDSEIFIMVE